MIRCKEVVEVNNTLPSLHLSTSSKKGTIESSNVVEDPSLYLNSVILSANPEDEVLSSDKLFEDSSLTSPIIGIPDLNYVLPQLHFRSVPLYNTPIRSTRGPQDIYCISLTSDPELAYNSPLSSSSGIAIWHPSICGVTSTNYPRFNVSGLVNLLSIAHKTDDTTDAAILTTIINAFVKYSVFTSVTPAQIQSGILYGDALCLQIIEELFSNYVSGTYNNLTINQTRFIQNVRKIPEPIIQLHEENGFITLGLPNDSPMRSDLKIYYILRTSAEISYTPPTNAATWTLYTSALYPTGSGYFDSYGAFIGQILAVCTTQVSSGTIDLSSKTCSKVVSRPCESNNLYIYTEQSMPAETLDVAPSSGASEPLDIFALG